MRIGFKPDLRRGHNQLCFVLFLVAGAVLGDAPQSRIAAGEVEYFPLTDVKLVDGPFLRAAEVNRDHLLRFNPDRLLAPYLTEAGLEPKAVGYPNWEGTGLNGHTAGHYISALAGAYATLGDEECLERLNYMVEELDRCQRANGDGYVGGIPDGQQLWRQIAAGDIRATGFSLNDRWVPLYNLHKTLAGLRDAHLIAGNGEAKHVLVKLADWCESLVSQLDEAEVQRMLACEHGGMNEVLADVAQITGDGKYLDLAQRFSHREILAPLAAGEDRLNGLHANTQAPKVIGFQRIAALGGGERYHRAAKFFWETVVGTRTIAFGGNSIAEHFPSPNQSIEWMRSREGPETCNTYNMLRLTEQLFSAKPTSRLADFYERALFNHILSSHHPAHGGYVYFTPARPRHYRVYSQPEQAFWCCVGSGMENHGRYGKFIYAHDDNSLYVNLFVASQLNWKEQGVKLTQQTQFPDEPSTTLKFSVAAPTEMAVKFRHPSWVKADKLRLQVNDEPWLVQSKPGSFATIDRTWQDGDRLEAKLPMHTVAEPLPYLEDYVALVHGPIVLAAKTGEDDLVGLVAGKGRMDHIAHGPLRSLDSAPMLVSEPEKLTELVKPVPGKPMTFTLAGAIRPDSFDGLQLIPFFRVHDARYMLYWRIVSPTQYKQVLQQIQAAERERLALDRATVDRVAPGEQQPETEHNFRGEDTETGMWRDRRFRHATGWFSYDLQTAGEAKLSLRVTYWGSDRRQFEILLNGELFETVDLNAPKPGDFVEVDYPIQNELLGEAKDKTLTVRFVAKEGSMAGGVYDVRLVRPVD